MGKVFSFLVVWAAVQLSVCPVIRAQGGLRPQRIRRAINDADLATLHGNTHPLARAQFEAGIAPGDLAMESMMLVLSRSSDQEAALQRLIDSQQDPTSPNFHHWLTPEQVGEQFGIADADIQTVTTWLESYGLQIGRIANSKTVIEFSGTASQVQRAFHTQIRKYVVNGVEHWANASDPQIPIALTPVVAGVATLHNFVKKPQMVATGQQFEALARPNSQPQFTSSTGSHALAPADYATIYNINPVYQSGINGSGVVIAVVGRTNINISDVTSFRSTFALTPNDPQIVVNGTDPGDLGGSEESEAILDTEWSGAVAPYATVKLVVSKTTASADGVDLSEEYIVDNNLGDVMTESFGDCESNYSAAQASFYSSLAEQAAVQGITYLVASGDAGAEGCDSGNETTATGPISVNILAANPYVIAVGGTEFNENGNNSTYWRSTNSSNDSSAISYIPEVVWNESCTRANCPSGTSPGLWAGGGGVSSFYSKPSWQTGVPGIPSDGARDVPDVSLSGAGHDAYLVCIDRSCTPNSRGRIFFSGYSGTSAATPSFAAVLALVVQKAGRQGQANNTLYRLAASQSYSSCNGSSAGANLSGCIFNDITSGNNVVPGETGYGTSTAAYQSGLGYDLASGLGSVNVTNLVNGWSGSAVSVPQPALLVSASQLTFGTVNAGGTSSQTITLSDTGSSDLTFSSFTITSVPAGQFSQTNTCGLRLSAGANCTVTVVFAPQVQGGTSGVLQISSNDSSALVVLTGTGAAPSTTPPTQTSLNFGNQKVVTWSAPQSVTFTNTTVQPVTVGTIATSGSNTTDFTTFNNCGGTISPGASCTISVVFNPQLVGTRSATVSIPTSDSSLAASVSLSGTGVLTGLFTIMGAQSGKSLDIANGSTSQGALIILNAVDGLREQEWQFVPVAGGYYLILNAFTGQALDNTNGSTSNGNLIQQYANLGDANQQWSLVPVDDVHYQIANRASGKVLDVTGGSTANGTFIQQWSANSNPQQLWTLVPAGGYNIVSALNGYGLEVQNGSLSAGSPIGNYTLDGSKQQRWLLMPVGAGYYAIVDVLSGKVLDVTLASTTDGTSIQQYDYVGGGNQQWQIQYLNNSQIAIVNKNSGMVLDVVGRSMSSGALIQQWTYLGGANQQWTLSPVTYYNVVNRNSGLGLDVPSGSLADGTVLQQWQVNGSPQQQWLLIPNSAGYYAIVNGLTGKAIDDTAGSTVDGNLIQQYRYLGDFNQQWLLSPSDSGYFEVLNRLSGKALDVILASTANGTQIQQYTYLGGLNQQWQFVPIP